jgi:hypothetical protein
MGSPGPSLSSVREEEFESAHTPGRGLLSSCPLYHYLGVFCAGAVKDTGILGLATEWRFGRNIGPDQRPAPPVFRDRYRC